MKKLFRSVAALAVVAASSGCGVQSGFIRDSITAQEFKYEVKVNALKHVRTAEGSAQVGILLCAIPLQDRLYARAMEDLHASAKLQENEVLTNLREDHATAIYLGFFCTQTVTISADVVRISTDAAPALSPAPLPTAQ